MSERIVVCCRVSGEKVGRPETRYFERARALTQQAEARGATLAAWSATTLAVAWDTESLDEAVEFACEVNADEREDDLGVRARARRARAARGQRGGARGSRMG